MAHPTAAQRFWSQVDKTESCWTWMSSQTGKGYGAISVNGKRVRAHRFSWLLHGFPEPASGWYHPTKNKGGDVLDHLCKNRLCVRPEHLELVPQAVNVQRMVRNPKANVYWEPGRRKWRAAVMAYGTLYRKRFDSEAEALAWAAETRDRLYM